MSPTATPSSRSSPGASDASASGTARGSDVAARLDVLDGLVGDVVHPVDQSLFEPDRLLAREGRDQDLVDAVVLDRVLDGGERRGAHRLARGVDVRAVHLGEGAGEALADLLARELPRAGADEGVAVRALGGARLEAAQEVAAGDRLRGDDERVGDVPADRVVVDADRHVRDRHLERALRPLDEVAAHQAVARLREAREKHLGRLEGADRVVEREQRIGVHDRALGLDPELGEDGLRHLDAAAAASESSARSTICPATGWFCGAAMAMRSAPASIRSRTWLSSLRPPATSFKKTRTVPPETSGAVGLGAVVRRVGHVVAAPDVVPTVAGSGSATSWPSSPARIAWRAPGTPNSYGPPTTRGISSKL